MKILVLIADRSNPPVTGAKVRNFYLWQEMAKLGIEIKILGLSNIPNDVLKDEIEYYPYDRPILPIRIFYRVMKSYHEWPKSQKLTNRINELCEKWQPDIIHAEELRMSLYFPQNEKNYPLRTLTFHNVESELNKKIGSSTFKIGKSIINWIHLNSLKKFEKKAIKLSHINFAFSKIDLLKYQSLYPNANWGISSNGSNVKGIVAKSQTANKNILFVGSLAYQPNVYGLNWFIDKVMPFLSPDIIVTVAGSNIIPELKNKLQQTKIQFIDTPIDLHPIYANCALCFAPIFEGSGTRGKILEALAHERMMITTKIGAEGLEITQGIVLAEEAIDFINQINEWTHNIEKRQNIAKLGRTQVLEYYDWSVVAIKLKKDWETILKNEYKSN